jgi:hypothetical protein
MSHVQAGFLRSRLSQGRLGGTPRGGRVKISRKTLYARVRWILEERDRALTRSHHPEVDVSRFDVAGGFNLDAVAEFSDAEFEEFARGLGVLKLDEEFER